MIGKRLGDFEITGTIGKGGMGQVYKGRQLSLDRDVAIKILPGDLSESGEFRDRFDSEAKAVASLVHENIIQMYTKGVTDDGVHYFAMEYVEGEDLSDKIKKGAVFSEKEAIDIAVQVCRGLEAAWEKRIIHRDIKPANLIITNTGKVKIADFGLAKNMEATKKLTQTNLYMGTAAYTSPEQGESKNVDQRTDIYSLGIVLYQLLAGQVPFQGDTPSSVIYKHVYEQPPKLRSINPRVSEQTESVVLKAIAKKQEERFQSATEFRQALEKAAAALNTGQANEGVKAAAAFAAVGEASPKPASKAPLVIMAAVLIALLGTSVLYASKYGYKALFAKVLPFSSAPSPQTAENVPHEATQGLQPQAAPQPEPAPPAQVEPVPGRGPSAGPAAVVPDAPRPGSRIGNGGTARRPDYPAQREQMPQGRAIGNQMPAETAVPPDNAPAASRRSAVPTVLVVASGEPDISEIVESAISKRLHQRSFRIATIDEIGSLSGQYGRNGVPLTALNSRKLNADILVYASVTTMNAEPLHFYGRSMEQYSSTISLKVFDAATKRTLMPPSSKSVNFTTLNKQENIEELANQLASGIPSKIEQAWKNSR